VGVVKVPVAEVILRVIRLEAETEHELLKTMFGVCLHDMPKNWPFANRHHWFGAEFGFFLQTRAQTPSQNEDRHPGQFRFLDDRSLIHVTLSRPQITDPGAFRVLWTSWRKDVSQKPEGARGRANHS